MDSRVAHEACLEFAFPEGGEFRRGAEGRDPSGDRGDSAIFETRPFRRAAQFAPLTQAQG